MNKTEYNWFRKVRREEDLFFGLELEVCSKVDSQELQRIVKEVEPKQEPFFIFKDDSSIGGKYDYRYEIVTVPCTPKYLRSEFKKLFEKLERLAKDKGGELGDYFDTSESLSNGIHIHIGKDSFEAESHIRRFLTVFNEKSPSIVEKFQAVAKRPERYDTSYYCKVGNAWEGRLLSYRLKKAYVKGRSQIESSRGACHCQKGVTIETRIFQGIFNLEHIFRCISLTEAVFHTTSGFKVGYRDFGPKFLPHLAKEIHSHKKYNSIKGDFPLCA